MPYQHRAPEIIPVEFLTPKEYAQLMGCCLRTVYLHIQNGTLPAWREGGMQRWRIPLSAVARYKKKAPE